MWQPDGGVHNTTTTHTTQRHRHHTKNQVRTVSSGDPVRAHPPCGSVGVSVWDGGGWCVAVGDALTVGLTFCCSAVGTAGWDNSGQPNPTVDHTLPPAGLSIGFDRVLTCWPVDNPPDKWGLPTGAAAQHPISPTFLPHITRNTHNPTLYPTESGCWGVFAPYGMRVCGGCPPAGEAGSGSRDCRLSSHCCVSFGGDSGIGGVRCLLLLFLLVRSFVVGCGRHGTSARRAEGLLALE